MNCSYRTWHSGIFPLQLFVHVLVQDWMFDADHEDMVEDQGVEIQCNGTTLDSEKSYFKLLSIR